MEIIRGQRGMGKFHLQNAIESSQPILEDTVIWNSEKPTREEIISNP